MTKRYDFHKYLPSINDVILVGDKRLKDVRIEYKLKEGPHVEIVDGGTKEKPDPKHPVINVINVQPDGWEYENEYHAVGEESEPPSLKLVSSDGKTKIVGENFYVYEAGEDYEDASVDPEEEGIWEINYWGSISITGNNEKRQQTISYSGTIVAIFIPYPEPVGKYYHDEWFEGEGSKEKPIKLNLDKIAEYILQRGKKNGRQRD